MSRRIGKPLKRPAPAVIRRFMKFVVVQDGHWRWMGAKLPKGYGKFNIGQETYRSAHRVSYAIFNGLVPHGMDVHHKDCCLKPWCVNPDHLALLTKEENTVEGNRRRHITEEEPLPEDPCDGIPI